MAGDQRQCDNCGEMLSPRGGLWPRFCPRCGHAVGAFVVGHRYAGASAPRKTCSASIAALLLGIISVAPICAPAGLAAIVVGMLARASVRESRGGMTGDGLALAGIVLGIIGSAIGLLVCAGVVL